MDKVDEILKKYPYIGEDIKKAQEELNKYIALQQDARNTVRAQVITGMPHGNNITDQTVEAVIKIIDEYQIVIDRCIEKINELLDLKKQLDKAITEFTEDEKRVIYLKYCKGVSINKMPYMLHWKCGRDKIYNTLNSAKNKIRKNVLL